jgi:hypothetical protein
VKAHYPQLAYGEAVRASRQIALPPRDLVHRPKSAQCLEAHQLRLPAAPDPEPTGADRVRCRPVPAERHACPTDHAGSLQAFSFAAGGCRGLPSGFPAAVLRATGPDDRLGCRVVLLLPGLRLGYLGTHGLYDPLQVIDRRELDNDLPLPLP